MLSGGEDEKFWFFLCSLKLGIILKVLSGKVLKGYWLDRILLLFNEYWLFIDMINSVIKFNVIKFENGIFFYYLYYVMLF